MEIIIKIETINKGEILAIENQAIALQYMIYQILQGYVSGELLFDSKDSDNDRIRSWWKIDIIKK